MTMYCPVFGKSLEGDEHHPATGELPAYWQCDACDCRIEEFDDEYRAPPEQAD